MTMDTHAALDDERDDLAGDAQATTTGGWVETALAALFAVSAVLFVSFIAVVTGLV